MRAVLLILILAVLLLIAAVATGFLDITQTRSAQAPDLSASENGVTAAGGQAPAFDVETGTVAIGADQRNVTLPVPRLQVNPPAANEAQPVNSMDNRAGG